MAADEDQSIESAEGALRSGDGVGDRGLLGEVAEALRDDRALRFGFRCGGIETGCVGARVQQQRGAGTREQFCSGAADAAGGTGDEIDAIDFGHHDAVVAGGNAPVRWKWLRKVRVAPSCGLSITCRAGPSSTTTPARMKI